MSFTSIPDNHFFKMSNSIFKYELTPIQFCVYSYLVCTAGNKERCWPSVKTIARNCGCSPNAAREAIHVLANGRFIKISATYRQAFGKTRRTNNTYFIEPLPYQEERPQAVYIPTPPGGGEIYKEYANIK